METRPVIVFRYAQICARVLVLAITHVGHLDRFVDMRSRRVDGYVCNSRVELHGS